MTDYAEVPRLGIGGPVGSGKTALIEQVVPYLQRQGRQVAVITNDILTPGGRPTPAQSRLSLPGTHCRR